ncbi:hypothetical protein [Clostridium nigeriense]|uniref:hypothetical protein n=1 Tax=Clostridium nigeriense TaxID=1805470 RepID=UPI000836A468|nr:hypothetical protein [Clostridium nigeriense]
MLKDLEEKLIIDDDLFLVEGIKNFINEYKKEKNSTNEKIYFKRYYDLKRNTISYIKSKRKEYENKIKIIENNINLLNKTFKELEVEKNLRYEEMKTYRNNNSYKEKLDDIIDAINENKRIISYENRKLNELKRDYENFNNASFEDERDVKIFFKYIKREFLRERKKVVEVLNFSNLNESELVLNHEYFLLITKKIILIQEELIGG